MSRIKTETKLGKRGVLNTTIREDVLEEFKSQCKEVGIPMNMILEIFMRQFCDGDFELGFSKNKINIE